MLTTNVITVNLEILHFHQIKYAIFLTILSSGIIFPVEATEKEWYEMTTVYQILPQSFKDTNGDGIGDLQGIREKLDYLHDIGIETLWIQPFYKSPMLDGGYDIIDFREIDPKFGSMEDFKKLVKEVHDKGMKLICDFVPNHTSDESEWFKKSVSKEDPYTDYYIWKDAKGFDSKSQPIPPNNWLSHSRGSAWRWHEQRRQFYFTQFARFQPDLNFRNPKVQTAIEDILRFWMDLGVDGFRIDAVPQLMEDEQLRDNPWKSPDLVGSDDLRAQIQLYSGHQNDTFNLVREWRSFVDNYSSRDNKTKMILLETYQSVDVTVRYFSQPPQKTTNIPMYFGLAWLPEYLNSTRFDELTHKYIDILPQNGVPNWQISNHDGGRLASKENPMTAEVMMMAALLLPGFACIYYGDELQMKNAKLRPDQTPNSKDIRIPARTPMQWDDSKNAGFSAKDKPWLPVNPDYGRINVKLELQDPYSHLNFVKRLVKLRKTPDFQYGQLETCIISEWTYMFVRHLDGHQPFLVLLNLGSESENVCISNCLKGQFPSSVVVHTGTPSSGYKPGDTFTISDVNESHCSILRPKTAVLLTTTIEPKSNQGTTISSSLSLSLVIVVMFSNILGKS